MWTLSFSSDLSLWQRKQLALAGACLRERLGEDVRVGVPSSRGRSISWNDLRLPAHLLGQEDDSHAIRVGRSYALALEIRKRMAAIGRGKAPRLTRALQVTVVFGHCSTPDWISMREALPAIEMAWAATASRAHEVRFVRLSESMDLLRKMRDFDDASRFVLTSHDKLPTFERLERMLGVCKPLITHLYGEFTYGGMLLQSVEHVFRRPGTQFVCTSSADMKTVALVYRNPRTSLLPLPIPELAKTGVERVPRGKFKGNRWIYVGRVSEQKNLHTLLLALWLVKQVIHDSNGLRLEVFGAEDDLGSPNMAKRFPGYLRYLKKLTRELGLEKNIAWRGFVPQEKLDRQLHRERRSAIFVSPSLHSDENFGIAALKYAAAGGRLVLSDWGGHRDLAKNFGGRQCRTVPVRSSNVGAFLSPIELARALATEWPESASRKTTDAYSLPEARRRLLQVIRARKKGSRGGLVSYRRTPLGACVLAQHLHLNPGNRRFAAQHSFKDYADPLAKPFFAAYGMRSPSLSLRKRGQPLLVAPWVRVGRRGISVNDPHRGRFSYFEEGRKSPQGDSIRALLLPDRPIRLSVRAARWLVERGFAF